MRDDIVFYIKLFPLTSIHPEAYAKSSAVLCEKDNTKALKLLDDVFEKKPVTAGADCTPKAVDETIRLGRNLGIKGTPTLVFQNGSVASGAFTANEIVAKALGN